MFKDRWMDVARGLRVNEATGTCQKSITGISDETALVESEIDPDLHPICLVFCLSTILLCHVLIFLLHPNVYS